MKTSAIVCAIAAASLSLGSLPAFSQGRVYDRNASNNPEIYQQTHPEDKSGRSLQGRPDYPGPDANRRRLERNAAAERQARDRRDFQRTDRERLQADQRRELERRELERRNDRRDFSRRGPEADRYYYGARGPEFRRGGYIPREYRNRQYYVDDWRSHRLAAPPRGHQWVQVGSDYVLIAVATGLIANLILSQ